MVDLRPDQLATVNAILLAEVPDYEIWAFGSRAQWTAKDSSDLDLAIVTERPLSPSRLSHLRQTFEQSYLSFTVDVVDLSKVTPEFRKVIEKERVVFRKASENGNDQHAFRERRSLPLEDAVETIIDYRGKTPKKVDSGIPLITAKIIKNGRIDTPTEFISPGDYDGWMRRGFPQAGDVLLTTEAPLGEVAQLEDAKIALAQRVVALRGKKDLLDNDFLKYMLQSREVQDQLKSRASGTTVQGIKQSELRKISLTLPPINEQRAIARVLGTMDDKIELNRRMNDTLEAIAQALFSSWFSENRAEINKESVQELLDRKALVIGDGYRAKLSEFGEDGLPFVRAGNLKRNGFVFDNAEMLSAPSVAAAGSKVSEAGDIAFTSKGSVGRTTLVTKKTRRFVYSPQVCFWRVIDQKQIHPNVLYRWMTSGEFMNQIAAFSAQTDMAEYVSLRDQRRIFVTLPLPESQACIGETLSKIDDMIAATVEQNQTLAALRDALLPRLLSGEIGSS